jgi:ATP adenylyltransferase
MVIPKRHAADMDDLTDDEMSDFFSLLRFSCAALRSALEPDGLNVGANLGKAAGAGAEDHLHFHIVARWNGDHNFMPVIADTMVMPDYLTRIYETLLPSFSADRDS